MEDFSGECENLVGTHLGEIILAVASKTDDFLIGLEECGIGAVTFYLFVIEVKVLRVVEK